MKMTKLEHLKKKISAVSTNDIIKQQASDTELIS